MNKAIMAAALAIAVALVGCMLIIPGYTEEAEVDAANNDFTVSGAEAKDSISATINNMSSSGSATITLNDDVTESTTVTINNGKSVTINLNGHKLTVNGSNNGFYISGNGSLTLDGTGPVDGNNIYVSSGSLKISESADVFVQPRIQLVQNSGSSMTIYGTLEIKDLRNPSGCNLYIYGTLKGGSVSNGGTVTLGPDSNTYLTNIKNNVDYQPQQSVIHVNVTHADEVWSGYDALRQAIYGHAATYEGRDVVVTVEGSADPANPYEYRLVQPRPNYNFHGNKLTLQANENTYAVVKLSSAGGGDDKVIIMSQTSVDSSIAVKNLSFVNYSKEFASLEFSRFENVAVEDCSFVDTRLFRSTQGQSDSSLMGSMTVTGCEFRCTGNAYDSAALTAIAGSILLENNTIDNYGNGIHVNVGHHYRVDDPGEPMDGEIVIRNNTVSNLRESTNADGVAIQVGGQLNGREISVSSNRIDGANYGVEINGNSSGTPASFDVSENSIVNTPVGINYATYKPNGVEDPDKIQASIRIQADNNYFAPDGNRGVQMTVESEGPADVSDLVQNDRYYTDSDMDRVTNGATPPWVLDDEDEYLPPMPAASDGSDDDTVTIVACAAAAVVAALMAVFLIIDRKGN